MSDGGIDTGPVPRRNERFATTRWSQVVQAGRGTSEDARQALQGLIGDYWYPLYAYVRRRGYQAAEAQDLTQGFFLQLLEKEAFQVVDQSRGRFRSFLLSSLNHFLANQLRREQAQKRGQGRRQLSFSLEDGEERYRLEPPDMATPESIFERRWAMTLLHKAVEAVRDAYIQGGKLDLFDRLKPYLGGDTQAVPYRQLAEQLGTTEGAVRVAVHRIRQRCRESLRREIAHTVTLEEEIDEELRYLFAVLRG